LIRRRGLIRGVAAGLSAGALGGCAPPARLETVPAGLLLSRPWPDMADDARVILDGQDNAAMGRLITQSLGREAAWLDRAGQQVGPVDYLALSGGGADGAFGAGILIGWTALGTRPEFRVVTGVSTGALAAPFAFLGPAFDRELESVYTQITQDDVMRPRGYLAALTSDSLYDSTPLQETIRRALTPAVMDGIAREYVDKGRLLMVSTTNLDMPVGVLWNLGAIAASGHRGAVDLVVQILMASAAVPGIFPPVMIRFEYEGRQYEEMHVDGGTLSQVVLYPASLQLGSLDPALTGRFRKRERRLWVIRNSRLGRRPESTERSAVKISSRALSALIATQGVGDLYQLYLIAMRDKVDYHVTYIPPRFDLASNQQFDQAYMNTLYRFGREYVRSGAAWSSVPPGYSTRSFLPQ
jgi:predicted acylesterase/phospholipase RssA